MSATSLECKEAGAFQYPLVRVGGEISFNYEDKGKEFKLKSNDPDLHQNDHFLSFRYYFSSISDPDPHGTAYFRFHGSKFGSTKKKDRYFKSTRSTNKDYLRKI